MKNIDVISAFIKGENKAKTKNLYIVGNKLINYNTVLAERDGNSFIINVTKYSTSTSKIQTYIRREMDCSGVSYKETHNAVRIGAQELKTQVQTA